MDDQADKQDRLTVPAWSEYWALAARTMLVLALVMLVVAISTIVVLAADMLILIFLGILFAIFLMRASVAVGKVIPVGYGWNLAIVVTFFLGLAGAGGYFLGGQIEYQIRRTANRLSESQEKLEELAKNSPMVRSVLVNTPFLREALKQIDINVPRQESGNQSPGLSLAPLSPEDSDGPQQSESSAIVERSDDDRGTVNRGTAGEDDIGASSSSAISPRQSASAENSSPQSGSLASEDRQSIAGGKSSMGGSASSAVESVAGTIGNAIIEVFRTTFGFVVNSAIIFFIGVFIAANPKLYEEGLVKLFPHSRRRRVRELLDHLGGTLWNWLVGTIGSMVITGSGTGIALWLLGVPLAGTLGVISGLLTFIPNIGAAISLGLAILIALPMGLDVAGMVVLAYGGFQILESYVVLPLILRHQVSMPPALLIAVQAIGSVLLGFLGAMVASPLLAVALVLVREAYRRDVLGDSVSSSI